MNKCKVLIADSTPSVRQFIRYSLQDHFRDLEFEVAANGKNIKKRLEDTHFDLILYDRDMPMLSGDELLKWLRTHATLKDISFVMISGDRDEKSLQTAIDHGADAYLIKPLLMDPLINKVREIFNTLEKKTFDRRKYKRFKGQGEVFLRFDSEQNSGMLINISMGGLLCMFGMEGAIPHILDMVAIDVQLDNKKKIEGLEGEIVRITVVDTFAGPKHIQLGIKFPEEISIEKTRWLMDLVTSLKS